MNGSNLDADVVDDHTTGPIGLALFTVRHSDKKGIFNDRSVDKQYPLSAMLRGPQDSDPI